MVDFAFLEKNGRRTAVFPLRLVGFANVVDLYFEFGPSFVDFAFDDYDVVRADHQAAPVFIVDFNVNAAALVFKKILLAADFLTILPLSVT